MLIKRFINGAGQEIVFEDHEPYFVEDFILNTDIIAYSSKGAGQDGSTYIGNSFLEGEVSIALLITGDTNEEYLKHIDVVRRIFNPKFGEGFLVCTAGESKHKLKCIPNGVFFPSHISKRAGKGLINLTANDPLWMGLQELKNEIALWVPNFSFPLELSADGIEIGYRSEILTANVYNDGDVESGMRIELKALATVVNPSFVNILTKDFIKLNTTMVKGQVITISTYYGEKRITSKLAGIESNLFNSIAQGSKFLQLDPGDNLFRYDADDGVDYLSVAIYHKDRYLGV